MEVPKKKSVDDIWKELNSRPPPRSITTGIPGFGIPGVQTRTRVLPKQQPTSEHLHPKRSDVMLQHDMQKAPAAAAYDPRAAGVEPQELQQYMSTLQRTINCLTDPDRNTRRSAISSLQAKLLKGDASTVKASSQLLQAVLAGPLQQPLTVLLSDPMERCRLTALQLLLDAVPILPDPTAILQGLLPQLVVRMGHTPVVEPAEEVRLVALQFVEAVIAKANASTITAAKEDLSLLLAHGLEDSFPDAKKAAAAALAALSAKSPAGTLEGQAERLLKALIPNLSHQHSKVRLAALSGLRGLVLSGLPAGLLSQQLAPALKPLSFDRATAVREAYYAALADWLGCQTVHTAAAAAQIKANGTAARTTDTAKAEAAHAAAAAHASCRTYAPVLLPLLLLGVTDPQSSIATAALAAVEEAGAAWQGQQQSATIPPQQQPTAQGSSVTAMETDEPEQQQENGQIRDSSSNFLSLAAVAAAHLPPPYQDLPNTGCQCMVAALLPQLLPGILTGLREWTASLRSSSARLLHTCLVMAGPAATQQLQQLLPALVAAMSEEDPEIVSLLASSCQVLGAFTPCDAWLPLLVDALTDSKAGPASKANALVVLSCLVRAAAAAQQRAPQQVLAMLVGALAADDVSGSDHAGVQNQLLSVVMNLLAWMPSEAVQATRQQLYLILLQLHGSFSNETAVQGSGGSSPMRSKVQVVMQLLADNTGVTCVGQLAEQHAQQLLPQLTADAGSWTVSSSHLLAFMSLLQTANAGCLGALMPEVAKMLEPILADADRDAGLRLSLLKLLDGLMENQQTAAAFGDPSNAALVLKAMLLPPLVWRAGKAAAAVRFQAVTALATFITAKLAPPGVLLAACTKEGGLLPLLAQCLDEDWYSDVRHTACYVEQQLLEQVGNHLDDGARRAIYPELLKRLDDSSNKVRIAACHALMAFIVSAGPGYCSTNSGYLAAGVVLHMDDGDQAVAAAACEVLEILAAVKPDVAANEVHKVQERFRARHYCERVLAAAAAASRTA